MGEGAIDQVCGDLAAPKSLGCTNGPLGIFDDNVEATLHVETMLGLDREIVC